MHNASLEEAAVPICRAAVRKLPERVQSGVGNYSVLVSALPSTAKTLAT